MLNLECPPGFQDFDSCRTRAGYISLQPTFEYSVGNYMAEIQRIFVLPSLFSVSHILSIILLIDNEAERKKGEDVKCKLVICCFLGD